MSKNGNKVGTRTPKWGKNGNKVGPRTLKVGQEWEQSGNKVKTRTPKWGKNGNKGQSGNKNPESNPTVTQE